MDLAKKRIDRKAEVEGVWSDFIEGSRVKVARMNNPKFMSTLMKLRDEKLAEVDPREELSEDEAREVLCRTMAKTILLDWEGFTDNGEEIEYSENMAFELFYDKQYEDIIVNGISELASRQENYRLKVAKKRKKK